MTHGCFEPTYPEDISCGPNESCPSDMICDSLDNRCRYEPLPSSCDDGVRNGTEVGVDCGGECPVCVPLPACQALLQSSGGGAGASRGFRVQLRIGAPAPMGRASSPTKNVTMGPGAAWP